MGSGRSAGWVPRAYKLVLGLLSGTLYPSDCSVHRVFQANILEWVAISSSRVSSQPRDQTHISYISCTGRQVLFHYCQLGNPTTVARAQILREGELYQQWSQ